MTLMGTLKRYLSAWKRHHRSHGFGIHSPYGFRFVCDVLGERLPYYSYRGIEEMHRLVSRQGTGRVISLKDAKMLFRVTNHFNPACILQVGLSTGVDSASMLAVSSTSRLTAYHPSALQPVAVTVLKALEPRVELHDDLSAALERYAAALPAGAVPYILINNVETQRELDLLRDFLAGPLASTATVLMRGIDRNPLVAQLWTACRETMPKGQTYTNDKKAILIATPRLQREDFTLWM